MWPFAIVGIVLASIYVLVVGFADFMSWLFDDNDDLPPPPPAVSGHCFQFDIRNAQISPTREGEFFNLKPAFNRGTI